MCFINKVNGVLQNLKKGLRIFSLLFSAILYFGYGFSNAQATVGTPAQIAGYQYGEGVIAVNPINPNNLVATGIDTRDQSTPSASQGGAYYSLDGGTTWATATIDGNTGNKALVDPEIDFDLQGNAYVISWTRNAGKFPGTHGMILYKSTDGGKNYTIATAIALMTDTTPSTPLTQDVNGNLITLGDGPKITIDKRAGVTPNPIYVHFAGSSPSAPGCGTIFAKSTDGGATFTTRAICQGGLMATGPNGEIYFGASPVHVSTDGGQTFTQKGSFSITGTTYYGWGNWGWRGFMVDGSATSAYKGNLYAAYGDGAEDGGDVLFRRSTDGGNTWSASLKINDDPAAAICGGATPQYLSNINVAPNGRIDIVWYDRRNDPYKNDCNIDSSHTHYADLYYAYSTDGGLTFSPNIRVSQQTTSSGGDYIWVESTNDGAWPWWSQWLPSGAPYNTLGRVAYTAKISNFTTPVTAGQDLTMLASFTGPSAAATGTNITLSDTVSNSGTGNAGEFNVGYYLSTDNVITTADTLIGSRTLTSLAAGNNNTGSASPMIPVWIAAGNYYLGAIADYNGKVPESNESNNTLASSSALPISISAGPDIVMVSPISGPSSGMGGTNITINSTVKNNGIGSTNDSRVCYYLSTDTTITYWDVYLGERTTGLEAGASDATSFTGKIPASVAAGNYYLGAFSDCYTEIPESNENNNTLSSLVTIPVTPAPPVATTGTASSVAQTSATLNGTCDFNGNAGTAVFEYWKTKASTTITTTATQSFLASSTSYAVTQEITGLSSATTYAFRVKCTNAGGSSTGATSPTFKTARR
ncbi:MAG: CARDB domain-containing protein [Gallionellaceae bacterium]|nr:CARDB domain-containing protein [Gallionellaceae bacterium]